MSGLPIEETLAIGMMHSDQCMTGIGKSGSITTMFGVVRPGVIWLISAPDIKDNARELIEVGRPWLDAMTDKYGELFNVVDERNDVHIRLIRHLGFTFGAPIENQGAGNIRVLPFKRTANV